MAKDSKDILTKLRERYKTATSADDANRRRAIDDIKFAQVPGESWDPVVRKERGDDRPMYSFPKLRVSGKRVINDMRSNRPQWKVRAFEDGDKSTAEVLEGLCRNIWNSSDGDTAMDAAAEYQVFGGMGAWRINTKYSDDTAWEQDIVVEPIRNPFCLYWDPSSQDALKRDAEYWILTERISREAFEKRYPKAEKCDFEGTEFDDEDEWHDEHTVRICEYWYREPKQIQVGLLSNGESVDLSTVQPEALAQSGIQVMRTRTVNTYQIQSVIASGDAILERSDWAGKHFPFVVVFGEHMVLDGKFLWWGIVRHAKDAQRAYDYSRTAAIEAVALAPQAKIWATPAQANGLAKEWATAHKKNLPYMLYNPDAKAPGPPVRIGGADVPAALISEAQYASEDIKAVTGIFDASLGARSNEQTGVAIRARQAQGEIATFNYSDNMGKGMRRTGEILIDLAPKIYDTERSIRILGADGAEKFKTINTIDPATGQPINDLSRGKFDVAITVGPSYATQRQEAVEAYTQIGQAQPALYQLAGDIIFRNMDLPGAEQIAERMKSMLPPPIQQAMQEGKEVPPEVQQAMAQAQQAMQQVQQHAQLVQQAAQEADQKSAEVEKAISDLDVKRAQFDADVSKQLAAITAKEASLTLKEAQSIAGQGAQEVDNDRQAMHVEMQQALASIQQQAAAFMTHSAEIINNIHAAQQPAVHVHEQPKPRIKAIVRQNGALIPQYEDDPASGVMQ